MLIHCAVSQASAQTPSTPTWSEIQLPALQFSRATIAEIATTIQNVLTQQDDQWSVKVSPEAQAIPSELTAALQPMTLKELLDLVADYTGVGYHIEAKMIVIDDGSTSQKRFYTVDENLFIERLRSGHPATPSEDFPPNDNLSSGDDSSDLKALFAAQGISFPPGTSIRYEPLTSQIVLINTQENINKFEQVLDGRGGPPQIEICGAFVSFAPEIFRTIGKLPEQVSTQELIELRNQGKGQLIQPFKIVTVNGISAVVENVTEIIYPTEYDVAENGISLGGGNYGDSGKRVFGRIPGAFETRETGQIIYITSIVSPDKRTINLTILPEVCELVRWRNEGVTYKDPEGNDLHLPMQMPVFKSWNVTTSIMARDGQMIAIGGCYTADRKAYQVLFLRAQLIDYNGNPQNK